MSKASVDLCDICKESVARGKCVICNHDVCWRCNYSAKVPDSIHVEMYLCNVVFKKSIYEEDITIMCKPCNAKFKSFLYELPNNLLDLAREASNLWLQSFKDSQRKS